MAEKQNQGRWNVRPDYSQVDPDYNESRLRSLRGAEGKPDHSRDWTISGRVLDSETKGPIQAFRVTPGQIDNFNQTTWRTARAVDGTNGVYSVFIGNRVSQPLLKAEDVLPGTYEANFEQYTLTGNTATVTMFTAGTELIVPEAKDKDDDSSVDGGNVELKKLTIPIPKSANAEK